MKDILKLNPKKTVKIPTFNKIKIGEYKAKTVFVVAITEDDKTNLDESFALKAEIEKNSEGAENHTFKIKKKGDTIYNYDIIIYGAALDNSTRVENLLNEIIVSKGGALAVPSDINLKDLTMSNKLVTGVYGSEYFKLYVAMLGNPEYVLIYGKRV